MWIYTHPACLAHDPGQGHPETPARLSAVLGALDGPRFAAVERREAPRATREQLLRVHTPDHVDRILAGAPAQGFTRLDPDTAMSASSPQAALHAAGAACAAVDALLAGETQRVFCVVRPPGHHATGSAAMGFCLFNNIAIAAAHALAVHGLQRVAIADFDVHHGNGTQAIFWHEPRVLYVSSHQMPLYPGSGSASERGVGNIVNAPLAPGAGSTEFRAAWTTQLLPELDRFRPELLLVSAGFDAHAGDPLADLQLATDDFGWITRRLCDLASRHALGRVASTLEGGYDLGALADCAAAHVAALMAV